MPCLRDNNVIIYHLRIQRKNIFAPWLNKLWAIGCLGVYFVYINNGKVRGNQRQKETFWEQPLDVPPTTKLSSRCYTIPMGMIASNRLPSNMFFPNKQNSTILGRVHIFYTTVSKKYYQEEQYHSIPSGFSTFVYQR